MKINGLIDARIASFSLTFLSVFLSFFSLFFSNFFSRFSLFSSSVFLRIFWFFFKFLLVFPQSSLVFFSVLFLSVYNSQTCYFQHQQDLSCGKHSATQQLLREDFVHIYHSLYLASSQFIKFNELRQHCMNEIAHYFCLLLRPALRHNFERN